MEAKDFAEAMTRMVRENGKVALLGDRPKAYISDYKGQFKLEADILIRMLEAGCAKYINEASNVPELKRRLVERMEDELGISPKKAMPLMDLLGLLLKGDTSKCAVQPAPAPAVQPAPAPAVQPTPAPKPKPAPIVQPAAPPENQTQTYRIGDRGPAGGIVFYDKGIYSVSWRYMEAAPANLQITEWGNVKISGTKEEIGTGKQNTKLIAAELKKKGENGRAAQLCRAYSLNGYGDWFLPSKNELYEMYVNLKMRNLGRLKDGWYWSSTQFEGSYAWSQKFTDNYYSYQSRYNLKNYPCFVRAVRVF